jgi:L-amino acid N-acyltransferase YncA
MHIRDFVMTDVAPANALTNRHIRETTVHWSEATMTDDEFRGYWLKGASTYPWLAAEIDGTFAGYAKASAWRERAAYRFTVETSVYIADEFHRRGVGKALMSGLIDALRTRGFRQAVAGIGLPNDASIRLHESLGFRKVGIFTCVGLKFNTWLDAGFWQLELDPQREGAESGSRQHAAGSRQEECD